MSMTEFESAAKQYLEDDQKNEQQNKGIAYRAMKKAELYKEYLLLYTGGEKPIIKPGTSDEGLRLNFEDTLNKIKRQFNLYSNDIQMANNTGGDTPPPAVNTYSPINMNFVPQGIKKGKG